MTQQSDRCKIFKALHVKGQPLILYNIWDAGSAKAVADAGALAIATGSWSVAAAQGYKDGEALPLDLVEAIARRIVLAVSVPVTIDFEGGYSHDPVRAADNVGRILDAGAIGINFEDQKIGSTELFERDAQCQRITAIRRASEQHGTGLFLNARTDLFLKAGREQHSALLSDATERARAYQDAGADGFFAPGLVDDALIAELCASCALPVNIMIRDGVPTNQRMAELGVARISYGPKPYIDLMKGLSDASRPILAARA